MSPFCNDIWLYYFVSVHGRGAELTMPCPHKSMKFANSSFSSAIYLRLLILLKLKYTTYSAKPHLVQRAHTLLSFISSVLHNQCKERTASASFSGKSDDNINHEKKKTEAADRGL
jgi:hypothetical protein